jgi:hypothetical protein
MTLSWLKVPVPALVALIAIFSGLARVKLAVAICVLLGVGFLFIELIRYLKAARARARTAHQVEIKGQALRPLSIGWQREDAGFLIAVVSLAVSSTVLATFYISLQ